MTGVTATIGSMSSHAPIAFSLFTGAGGFDLGVGQAGFSTVYAVEYDGTAVATLNRNRERFFPELPETRPIDITQVNPFDLMDEARVEPEQVDLLFGGPPCVAFSKSGFHLEYKREGRDPKANLLTDYLRFLDAIRPATFMLENVFGLAYRNKNASFFEALLTGIRGLGYSVTYGVLNAADHGVPQNRQRLFVIGARDGQELQLPAPTHWGQHERRIRPDNVDELLPHVTAADALADLDTTPEDQEVVSGKYGHLLADIPPGGNYLYYTAKMGYPNPMFEWRSRYWTFLLKLDPNRPASTIQGQPGPYVGPFHWDSRRLRTPELKRLQGFPDDFDIEGTRNQVQLQVGNSVPPRLGSIVADAIKRQIAGEAINLQAQLALV